MLHDKKITAVLLHWNRSDNIKLILKNLFPLRLIGEIILWNNNPAITLTYSHPKLTVINSQKNYYTFARYAAAMLASNEIILFHDDDLLLAEKQLLKLYSACLEDPTRIYGTFGRILETGRYMTADAVGDVDIILGRVMLFRKSLLNYFWKQCVKFTGAIEDDILFSLSLPQKHRVIGVGTIQELPDPFALYRRPDHEKRRQEAVDSCLNMQKQRPAFE